MSLSGSHKRALWDSTSVPFNTGAGSLSPDNDTPQLHDRYGGSEDDDGGSGYGADSYDDDVLYNMKELWVVQTELCRRCWSLSEPLAPLSSLMVQTNHCQSLDKT